MEKIEALLKQFGMKYSYLNVRGKKELQLFSKDDEPWGNIGVKDGKAYFVHGQHEPEIPLDSEDLPKWVKAYTEGFDEFDALL